MLQIMLETHSERQILSRPSCTAEKRFADSLMIVDHTRIAAVLLDISVTHAEVKR